MREPFELEPDNPFDRLARDYDARFTDSRLGRLLRDKVQRRLGAAFAPGDHVLELGCGTGEDAAWLAGRGVRVSAIDASPEMLAAARRKAARRGVEDRVGFRQLDLRQLGGEGPGPELELGEELFDGGFSNFGALNGLAERASLAAALAARIRPGGPLLLVVMGPFCALEVLGHVARGRLRAARRRFRPGTRAHLVDGRSMRVWYPSPRQLRREFATSFRCLHTTAIGLLLPPTDFAGVVERWPRLTAVASAIEDWLAPLPPLGWLADHYLLTLERRRADD